MISTRQIVLLLIGLALLAGLVWLLVLLQPMLVALTIAGVLAYLLNPLVVRLAHKLRGRRPLAAALIFLLALMVVSGLVGSLGAAAWDQWPRLQSELVEALIIMEGWLERPFSVLGITLNPEIVQANLRSAGAEFLSSLAVGNVGLLAGLTENLLWSLVGLVSFYYLLKDGYRIMPELLRLIPSQNKSVARELLDDLDNVWSVFLRVQLFIFAVLAMLLVSSTLLIIWLFRQGWLSLSPIGLVLLLIAVYVAIQQVDNLWLRPQLMGQALKLHPGIIFVGLIAGLTLGGLLGALLIVPIIATLKLFGRFAYLHFVGELPQPEVEKP